MSEESREKKEEVFSALEKFVIRVAENKFATPEELAALPEVANIVLQRIDQIIRRQR